MKKTTIVALVAVLVLVVASGAFAWGGRGGRMAAPGTAGTTAPMMMRGMVAQQATGTAPAAAPMTRRGMVRGGAAAQMARGGMAGRGAMSMWAHVEIPQEIRDMQAEMQKLSIDMRTEMRKNPIDRAKIEEMYKKRVELRDALSGWRMKTKLDMIEKLQK